MCFPIYGGKASKSMGSAPFDYDEIVRQRFCITLRSAMDKHGLTCKSLFREIGIDDRTIESHRAGITSPSYAHTWRYIKYFGADFLNNLAEPAGITGSIDQDGKTVSADALSYELAKTTYLLEEALLDGRIDANEQRVVNYQLSTLMLIARHFVKGRAG